VVDDSLLGVDVGDRVLKHSHALTHCQLHACHWSSFDQLHALPEPVQ
jgi:hypothetical protein